MSRPCAGCGTLLPEGGRSRYCAACWPAHRAERNRANTRAFRDRARDAQSSAVQFPTGAELEWLDQLYIGLAEPVGDLVTLHEDGRPGDDPDLLAAAALALDRFDGTRSAFEAWVAEGSDPEGFADRWREFFQNLREALQ